MSFFHVEDALKIRHFTGGQVEGFAVNLHVYSGPVAGVQDFGKIARIAVFPPAHAGFVGIKNARYVVANQGLARILFFKIAPLAHSAVAEAHQTFGNFVVVGMESLLNHAPRVVLNVLFHRTSSVIKEVMNTKVRFLPQTIKSKNKPLTIK